MNKQNVLKRWISLQLVCAIILVATISMAFFMPSLEGKFSPFRLITFASCMVLLKLMMGSNLYWVSYQVMQISTYLKSLSRGNAVSRDVVKYS